MRLRRDSVALPATVVGLFIVVRRSEPHRVLPYRTWGYPVVPLVVNVVSVWTLGFVLTERPLASLAGLATVAAGVALYWWDSRGAKETHGGETRS